LTIRKKDEFLAYQHMTPSLPKLHLVKPSSCYREQPGRLVSKSRIISVTLHISHFGAIDYGRSLR